MADRDAPEAGLLIDGAYARCIRRHVQQSGASLVDPRWSITASRKAYLL